MTALTDSTASTDPTDLPSPPTLQTELTALLARITLRHDAALARRLQQRLDQKTKPIGALGRLGRLALQIGLLQGRCDPLLAEPQRMVFAADYGLVRQGVSDYPQAVTWQRVEGGPLGRPRRVTAL